jgi:hypothetical protein
VRTIFDRCCTADMSLASLRDASRGQPTAKPHIASARCHLVPIWPIALLRHRSMTRPPMLSASGAIALGAGMLPLRRVSVTAQRSARWKCAVSPSTRRGQSNRRRLARAERLILALVDGPMAEVRPRAPPCPRINHFDWLGSEFGSAAAEAAYLQVLHGPCPRKSASGSRTSTSPTRDREGPMNHFSAQLRIRSSYPDKTKQRDGEFAARLLEEFSIPHEIW